MVNSVNDDGDDVQAALPGHWNQKQELGGNDQESKYSWAQVIRASKIAGLRLTRGQGVYKLYLSTRILQSASLDVLMDEIRKYESPKAQR